MGQARPDLTAQQVELLEARLHAEALRASTAEQLPPELERVREALLRHAARQRVDLEPLWLDIERRIGRAGQHGELRRLIGEEISEQARPVGFAAVGGALLFGGLTAGQPGLDGVPAGDGAAEPQAFAAHLVSPDLDDALPPAVAAGAERPPLVDELDEVLESWPDFEDALAAHLERSQAEPEPHLKLAPAPPAPRLTPAPAPPAPRLAPALAPPAPQPAVSDVAPDPVDAPDDVPAPEPKPGPQLISFTPNDDGGDAPEPEESLEPEPEVVAFVAPDPTPPPVPEPPAAAPEPEPEVVAFVAPDPVPPPVPEPPAAAPEPEPEVVAFVAPDPVPPPPPAVEPPPAPLVPAPEPEAAVEEPPAWAEAEAGGSSTSPTGLSRRRSSGRTATTTSSEPTATT